MISLYDLLQASSGQLFGRPVSQLFEDFCFDAEQAAPDRLYVALKTEYGDTHIAIHRAIQRGVAGVLCQDPPNCETDGVSVLLVKDTVAALLDWAQYMLGRFGTKVVAVTGIAGKSITVDAIQHALEPHLNVHTAPLVVSGPLSVPMTMAKLTAQHQVVVVKLGVTQIGDMPQMIQAMQPDVGVVTHIGELYDEAFGSLREYVDELALMVNYLSPNGLAVLNHDDDLVRAMSSSSRARVKTVGKESFGADYMAYNVKVDATGTTFDLRYGTDRLEDLHIPLFGAFHLYGVLCALSVAEYFDIPIAEVMANLAEARPLPGHMNSYTGRNGALLIDDAYNATSPSTLSVLDWLEEVRERYNRVFFVAGDIQVPSMVRTQAYRHIGRRVSEVADVFVSRGIDVAMAAKAALDSGMDPQHVHIAYSAQDVTAVLRDDYALTPDDLVLVKGGAASQMEQIVGDLLQNPDEHPGYTRPLLNWEANKEILPDHLSWLEIDSAALADNVRNLKSIVGRDVALMAVVKANGYGHGALLVARTALRNGATYLAVSSVADGIVLRDGGITAPILIFNYTPAHMIRLALQHNLTLTLYDADFARTCDRIAYEYGVRLRVHLKIDTGMGRLGAMPDESLYLCRRLMTLNNLDIEGIYTHFSSADDDSGYTEQQIKVFREALHRIQNETGFKFPIVHACNSAATLTFPEAHFNMVRCGIALYGLHPSKQVQLPDSFRPVLTWKTSIAQVKTLPPGHSVGYGRTYRTKSHEKIAIIPVGYSDGFRRGPNNWGEVLINGQRAPLIGQVSMEKSAISVTHIPDVAIGDEVVLIGTQGQETLTAEEIAERLGTINYELMCGILPGVERR